MATIVKSEIKSGTRYKTIIRRKNKVIKAKTFLRKTDAREWARKLEANLDKVDVHDLRGIAVTFNELAKEYLNQWQGRDPFMPNRIKWWEERIGRNTLIEIRPDLIFGFLEEYANGKALSFRGTHEGQPLLVELPRKRSPASVNKMKATLSAVLTFAVSRRYIETNPARTLPSLTLSNKVVRWLNLDERNRLLKAAKRSNWPMLHLLIVLALTTGARKGSLLSLRWEKIDFSSRTYELEKTKNGRPLTLTFPPSVIQELMKHREREGLIFKSKKCPDKPMEFRKHWLKALEQAEIENFRFHDLRHTAASYLMMGGATLLDVATLLGHKSTASSERYTHLSHQHQQKISDRVLGNLLQNEI